MASNDKRLTSSLNEVLNWSWSEFNQAELGKDNDAVLDVILNVIRSCRNGKISAIRLALDRIDGKIETKVRIEVPSFYTLYPYAKAVENSSNLVINDGGNMSIPAGDGLITIDVSDKAEEGETTTREDIKKLTLRETLSKLSEFPSQAAENILLHADAQELHVKSGEPLPPKVQDPLVKTVVSAVFIGIAQEKGTEMKVIAELFDQLEGKVEKVLRLVGEDVFITSYAEIAPEGAVLNEDGVFMVEEKAMTALWRTKLIPEGDDEDDRYTE